MARSDPNRSRYCATRHLLRNLDQPRSLRRNPLAREAFGGRDEAAALSRIARRVDAALRTMDSPSSYDARSRDGARHAAILLRVDVQRHDPRIVAADLGFSSRQFHRARRAAHDRFYIAFLAEPSAIVESVEADFISRLLGRAASLADSGETTSAAAILDEIASSADDPATRVEALIRQAENATWTHQIPHAWRYLTAARSVIAAGAFDVDRRVLLQDLWDGASLSLRWLERGPAAIREPSAARHGPANAGRAALVRSAAALLSGDAAYAAHLLRRLDRNAPGLQAPEAIVDLLMLEAQLGDFNAENALHSEKLFARAASVAREHGLRGRELYASHQLSVTRWARSREGRDRSAYRALVDRVDRSLPLRLRSYLTFAAADAELAMGHPRRALLAAEASAALSMNGYESFSARALAAGALLRLRRVGEAGVAAAIAADAARAEGHARVLSIAQRISAQAHLARRDRRAARAAIAESIECARYFSSAHALAAAHAVRERIVGR